jgi:pyruvate formate lyase activating enzyme
VRTIESIWRRGIWLEIVTLIVPGFNDDPAELRDMGRFIRGLSPDIPWHVTAFHKDYKMTAPDDTGAVALRRAADVGREEGLRFVYAGNLPGRVDDLEDTRCPGCGAVLIARTGYRVHVCRITEAGTCPGCGVAVPGVWSVSVRHPALPAGHAGAADAVSNRVRTVS